MQQEQVTLHQSIQAFLDQQPLYYSDACTWRTCTWNTMPCNLQLKFLLGCPLHKLQWSSHNLPIKSWQQIFPDYTTPRIWELLQDEGTTWTSRPLRGVTGKAKTLLPKDPDLQFTQGSLLAAPCHAERPHAGT
jgi:hypothetical protein